MRRGVWDASGFLADDEVLADRIEADLAICAELDTTPEALGARLLDLLAEDGSSVTIEPGDDVDGTDGPGGAVTCPWALEQDEVCLWGPGGNPSADRFTIVLGDRTLDGYTLSAHLIANHRFFGGLRSRFRIDPMQARAILEPDAELDDEPDVELD